MENNHYLSVFFRARFFIYFFKSKCSLCLDCNVQFYCSFVSLMEPKVVNKYISFEWLKKKKLLKKGEHLWKDHADKKIGSICIGFFKMIVYCSYTTGSNRI